MSDATLSQRLKAARSRAFVGRVAEVGLFRQALQGGEASFSMLWVHGPGGIGKSAFLRRLADEATSAGAHVVLLDARTCEPTPDGVRRGVGAPAVDGDDGPGTARGGASVRRVLLLDTAELLAPVEDWLREDFLPSLPAGTLIVLATRHMPGPRWRVDLGWAQEMRVVRLENLEPDAAGAFLAARGIPQAGHANVLAVTHGHPLALALVADVLTQRSHGRSVSGPLTPADLSDVLPALLERFVDEVPDPVHRAALQILGHARVTTEGLLRAVLGAEHATDCFAWLRGLSFAQVWTSGRLSGLTPHDLARDVLDQDLLLRDPEGWTQLRRKIRSFHVERALSATGAEQVRAVSDLLWFHRASPALSGYPSWDEAFTLWAQQADSTDLTSMLDLVLEHEGPESVRLHRAWWERQPSAFTVIRDRPGTVQGFVVHLNLDTDDGLTTAQQLRDPLVVAALQHVNRDAPLGPGQHACVVRSWIGRDGYHQPTPTQQAVTGVLTRIWIADRDLAVSVAYSTHASIWTPMFAYIDYAHAPDADVDFGGRRYAAYVHDWRVTPILDWLELLHERENWAAGTEGRRALTQAMEHAQRHLRAEGFLALSQQEFAAAVRAAFKSATRPAELARNPLLTARVLRGAGTTERRPTSADLRDLLDREVEALQTDPHRERLARVLTVTYLAPAATQEAAAARLGLPFSTYRRHLGTALKEVSEALWERELHGGHP